MVVQLVVQKILQKSQMMLKMEISITKINVQIVKNSGMSNFKFSNLEFLKLMWASI